MVCAFFTTQKTTHPTTRAVDPTQRCHELPKGEASATFTPWVDAGVKAGRERRIYVFLNCTRTWEVAVKIRSLVRPNSETGFGSVAGGWSGAGGRVALSSFRAFVLGQMGVLFGGE
jgi:hypothetical protein